MLGQRLFKELTEDRRLGKPAPKGRNNKLVYRRNECLLARYFYYAHFKKLCYEDILRTLIAEFFLSPKTIANIVQNNTEQLLNLKERALVMYYFQNNWPHLKW